MYTIAFIKVRAFQSSKRHISTIHNLELCTPSHSSKYELFNCPNVISQQSTIYSYVHHHITQSTSFSIVQTSYLTIHNLQLCTPLHSSKYELFNCPNVISLLAQLPEWCHWCLYYAMYLIWCIKVNNDISLLTKLPEWCH